MHLNSCTFCVFHSIDIRTQRNPMHCIVLRSCNSLFRFNIARMAQTFFFFLCIQLNYTASHKNHNSVQNWAQIAYISFGDNLSVFMIICELPNTLLADSRNNRRKTKERDRQTDWKKPAHFNLCRCWFSFCNAIHSRKTFIEAILIE